MAATLDQIISSLQSVYQPQLDSIAQQQQALPGQYAAQTAGVNAAKDDAFNGIVNSARQRGTGVAFGGIPLQEQAQYTASTYAPALANLQTSQNNQSQGLIDAINKVNQDKFNTANGLYQFGQTQDLEQQKLAEQQREFDAQQKAAAASANSLASAFGNYGGGTPTQQPQQNDPYASIDKNAAVTSVNSALKSGNLANLNAFIKAITTSAHNGNIYDQYKLGLINSASNPASNSAYNPAYANLIKQALSYKVPAAAPKVTTYPTANPNAGKTTSALLGIR